MTSAQLLDDHLRAQLPGWRAVVLSRDPLPQGTRDAAGQAALTAYTQARDKDLKRELGDLVVRCHMGIIFPLVRHYVAGGSKFEELVGVAQVGLAKALKRYDPERGLSFSTFACPTIMGELKRYFRDHGWAVRPPRPLQELYLTVRGGIKDYYIKFGVEPDNEALAKFLSLTVGDVQAGLAVGQTYSASSLDELNTEDEGGTFERFGSDDPAFALVEDLMVLGDALAILQEADKRASTIIRLRFWGNMTQSQIAAELGISQMHVSRLLARALGQLREIVTA